MRVIVIMLLACAAHAQTNFPYTPDRVTSNDLAEIMLGTWERKANRLGYADWTPTNRAGDYFLQSVMAAYDAQILLTIPYYTWRPFGLYSSNVAYTVQEYFAEHSIGNLSNKWTSLTVTGTNPARYATAWEGWATDVGMLERYKALYGMSNAVRAASGSTLTTATVESISVQVVSSWDSEFSYDYTPSDWWFITNQPASDWSFILSQLESNYGANYYTNYIAQTSGYYFMYYTPSMGWEPVRLIQTITITAANSTNAAGAWGSGRSRANYSTRIDHTWVEGPWHWHREDVASAYASRIIVPNHLFPSNYVSWRFTASVSRNHDYTNAVSLTVDGTNYNWANPTNGTLFYSNALESFSAVVGSDLIQPESPGTPSTPPDLSGYITFNNVYVVTNYFGETYSWSETTTMNRYAPTYYQVKPISFTNWDGEARTSFQYCTNRWW